MAGLYEKQAEIYARARPRYPDHWFSNLASLTAHHKLAWDAGTGNGQAALKIADHYDRVIATDISEGQIRNAFPHPKVQYFHTPESTTEDEFVALLGGEGSVDLVIVATAVHWFDLPSFYSVVNRVLRKPGGIIAVWGYAYDITMHDTSTEASFQDLIQRFYAATMPYSDPRTHYAFKGYKTLPFPFESVGLGSEGNPVNLDIEFELSLDDFIAWMRTPSAVATAKAQGVDLVNEEFVRELHAAWGGGKSDERKKISLKAFMLAGKAKLDKVQISED